MIKYECNWLDTKNKKGCKPRGMNIEPVEKFLIEKGGYAKPIGLALQKEYGKRISTGEYWQKAKEKGGSIEFLSMGLGKQLRRVNHRITEQIKEETRKHLK